MDATRSGVQARAACGHSAFRRALVLAATCWCLLLPSPAVAYPPYSVRLNLVDDFLQKGWAAR